MSAHDNPAACLPEIAALVESLRGGDVRALSRAISLVEDNPGIARKILSCCFQYTGTAVRIGVTGPAGAGKSTLIGQLARQGRDRGAPVGVIAVDPTSPYSGGAILGDRIRMQPNERDPSFYMRSMATRNSLGGLSRAVADAVTVMEAAGKQRLFIETVGAGQDEVEIVRLADVTIVVLAPGLGDEVQALKAGLMEIADIFVLNKCDREGADRTEKEVRAVQALAPQHDGWVPPIVRTVGTTGQGIVDLGEAVDRFWSWLQQDGRLMKRRKDYWRRHLLEMVEQEWLDRVRCRGLDDGAIAEMAGQVARRERDPYELVPKLVERLL